MKILLIRPAPDRETIGLQHVMICEPLELEYLYAAVADKGHTIEIVDMILEKRPLRTFLEAVQPDLVAVTAYIVHVAVVIDTCQQAKRICPGCRTVVGGVHAEVVPGDFKSDAIDFVIGSGGVKAYQALVNALEHSQDTSGICGVWNQTESRCPLSYETDMPIPHRDSVSRYRSRYYYMFHNPCALIKTAYGCPFSCRFCFCREITGHCYYERPIDQVVQELKGIPERDIYIVDDNFLYRPERIRQFCRAVQEAGLDKRFLVYGRADFIVAHPDVMEQFKACGGRSVIVGLESCQGSELEQFNKKSSVEVNEEAVSLLARLDIDCYGTLILGMDWDKENFRQLRRWLRRLGLVFVNLQPLTPLPGTELFDEYKSDMIIPRSDYAKWDLAHLVLQPTRMTQAAYYWQIITLYYAITLRPSSIITCLVKYKWRENLKMALGAGRVGRQYIARLMRAWRMGQ
jgi:hopanoid C-3 methylase